MKDFLKQATPYLFVAFTSFVVGSFVALHFNPDNSIYFEAKFSENTGLLIGKNSITVHDLASIGKNEAALLQSKIKGLDYHDYLSVELRELRDQAVGPFQELDIELLVKFTDNKNFNGNLAQACRGEVLFKEINIFRITAPDHSSLSTNGMMDFKVLLEKDRNHCVTPGSNSKTIWIHKETARNWLKTEEGKLPPEIKAKASIIRTILYKNDGSIMGPPPETAKINET